MRERFGASDASCRLRFHTQTGGVTLTAQQPLNNVVRVAVQALAAVLGGTQSLHTNGYDEALALPTAEAATLALRTQQIIALRERASRTPPIRSPGSYYVEHLTTELERRALELLAQVDELGGAAKAIDAGFFQEEIARSAYEHQLRVERGETVDRRREPLCTMTSGDARRFPRRTTRRSRQEQVDSGWPTRAPRDAEAVQRALAALGEPPRATWSDADSTAL